MPCGSSKGAAVLLLSHTVGDGVLALGNQWHSAAARRLELRQRRLRLCVAKRGPAKGEELEVSIGERGVEVGAGDEEIRVKRCV